MTSHHCWQAMSLIFTNLNKKDFQILQQIDLVWATAGFNMLICSLNLLQLKLGAIMRKD